MTFYWVDERCVGPDHPDSNYGLARRELLSMVPATHFRMRGRKTPLKLPSSTSSRSGPNSTLASTNCPALTLCCWAWAKTATPAPIFPNSPALAERKRLVIDQYVPERKADRLTLTLPVINNARCCMFLVTGRSDVLSRAAQPAGRAHPARAKGAPRHELIWVVDPAAARANSRHAPRPLLSTNKPLFRGACFVSTA